MIRSPKPVVVFALLLGLCLPSAGQDPQAPKDPALTEGPLTHVAGPISKILVLQIRGGKIALDREVWNSQSIQDQTEQQIEQFKKKLIEAGMPEDQARVQAEYSVQNRGVRILLRKLQQEMQATRSGMRPAAKGSHHTLSSQHLDVEMVTGEDFRFTARENTTNAAHFELVERFGDVTILISRLPADWILILRQSDDGFVVSEQKGDQLEYRKAASFAELYRTDRAYVRDRLLPVLSHYGVAMVTPDSPDVRKVLLEMLADPVDQDERDEVRQLIAELGGAKFKLREAAGQKLKANYVRWLGLILAAAENPATPAEAKVRLNKLIAANAGEHRNRQLVWQFGLVDDADYLKSILPDLEGDAAPLVRRRLEKLEASKPAGGQ